MEQASNLVIELFVPLHQGAHFSPQANTEECTGWIKSLMSFSCSSLQSVFWHHESQRMVIYYTKWDTELGKWFSWHSMCHVDMRIWGCEGDLAVTSVTPLIARVDSADLVARRVSPSSLIA